MSFPSRNLDYEPIGEAHSQSIENPIQSESILTLSGYKTDSRALTFYHLFCIVFLGIPYVIFTWFPKFKVLQYRKCSLQTADVICVSDGQNSTAILKVLHENYEIPILGFNHLRYFVYQHSKFLWDPVKGMFALLDDMIPRESLNNIVEQSQGLVELEQRQYLQLYGPNKIEIKIKSYWTLFIEEVFNPFYVFQSFSVILWCFDEYVIYAGCVFILTVFSIATSLIQTRKQSESLYNLIESAKSGDIDVLRRHMMHQNAIIAVDPALLVPGDLIVIPKCGCVMSCDAILLNGHCIVNESMLTGESVPITKTPPTAGTQELYSDAAHKRHTLFCGTRVIQTRYYGGAHVLARVTRTGFYTTKGALIRSIMFPAPLGLRFQRDSLKFVFFLFMIAACGMGWCLYLYIERRAEVREIIIRTLDIITIVVPPALPAAMTVGIVYSMNRLKKLGIFCISPQRINVSGKLKLACFDKTGTLTNEGLDMACVLPVVEGQFTCAISLIPSMDVRDPVLQAMATCHSLTRIDGNLNGDPLDLNMFDSTKWELDEPASQETTNYDMLAPTVVKPCEKYYGVDSTNMAAGDIDIPYEIGIIRQFPFSSTQQCMSVICRILGSPQMTAFTKGAPEKLLNMCLAESIPANFGEALTEYTTHGYRVISVAYKTLSRKVKWKEAQQIHRNTIECDLIFLGFIVMQNTLKPESTPVLESLRQAQIRTVMITGDNIFTAISVARDCNMIQPHQKIFYIRTPDVTNSVPKITIDNVDTSSEYWISTNFNNDDYHFAMDGEAWGKLRLFYPDLLPLLLLKTTVFGRFQPDQKTQLITMLQSIDYVVSMVGDGANDCGALKAAHIGISLSQAEASVAAPFTSKIENISCLLFLIMEGRCALVTSFAVFKYMALYSLIQFFTILILYKHHSILGDEQFLFIDLIITTSLAVSVGRQGPGGRIVAQRPMGSLVTHANTIPLLLQVATCGAVQLAAVYYLSVQPWYQENGIRREELIVCWQNTVLFTVSCFQYVIMAIIYSKGKPHRQPLIRNGWLLFSALGLTCFTTFLLIAPTKWAAEFFELMYLAPGHEHVQHVFRYKLMVFPIGHLVFALFIEYFIAERRWLKRLMHCITRKKGPKNRYKSMRFIDLNRILQAAQNRSISNQTDVSISC